jgi:hypothetical protein
MKKLMLVAAAWLVSAGVIFAQSVEKYKKVKQEEVPALVQTSLKNDFNIASADGTWSLQYSETSAGVGKPAILKPVSYTFRQKNDGKKVEIRFSPSGVLEHARGIEKNTEGHRTGS